MANRFVSPQQQFISFAGQPYAAGKLYFYVSGTSTPTPTYSDEGLSIPNTNPVILDSAGDAGSIFLDPGISYKVVLQDSNSVPIWTFDPVIPIDSNTGGSGFTPIVSCNASGTNAITLTPITPSQQPALYSNFQVFAFVPVSTTTAAVSLQVGTLPSESVYVAPGIQAGSGTFVANDGPYYVAYGSLVAGASPGFLLLNQNIGAIQSQIPLQPPQGRLTLTSQTPVMNADVISATNVYWTPWTGLGAPIHNGSSIVSTILSGQLSLALTTAQVASGIYDIYLAYNGGSPVIGTGPSWAAGTSGSVTAGSCARGTGAGGAAIVRTQGIWTNAASMSLIYNLGGGNVTLAVAANQGILLGSIFIDGTAGQVSANVSYGQSRKWGVSNAYNREPIALVAGDSTATYSYSTSAIRAAGGNSANSVTIFSCLPEESFDLAYVSFLENTGLTNGQSLLGQVGIGYNATNAFSGLTGELKIGNFTGGGQINYSGQVSGRYLAPAALGINVITALENGLGGASNVWYGTQAHMQLSAQWRG